MKIMKRTVPLPPVRKGEFEQLKDGVFGLGLNIFLATTGTHENGIVAPTSLSTVLGILYQGARGETREELLCALTNRKQEPNDEDDVVPLLSFLDYSHNLIRANRLYVAEGHDNTSTYFVNQIHEYFKADIATLPLRCPDLINDWVSEKTLGRITNALHRETINADTRLIVISAIAFDGSWRRPFEVSDHRTSFKTLDGREVATTFMVCSQYFKYAFTDDFEAVEIPYETEDVSFVVFMPVIDFEKARRSITVQNIKKIMSTMAVGEKKIRVILPKFRMEVGKSLVDALRNVGIVQLFDATACDLRNINYTADLMVNDITQKVMFKIDERGTEAASVTVSHAMNASGAPKAFKPFIADRPFLFAIWSKKAEIPLFFGQFCDPEITL
jgi:serpin B